MTAGRSSATAGTTRVHAQLRERIAEELGREAPSAARCLSDAIVARHGDAVSAVLFYGSCLRKQTHEGVLDFYA